MNKSMFSSGEIASATTSNDPVDVIVRPENGFFRNMKYIQVTNEGTVAGFVTFDGVTWIRLPAQQTITMRGVRITSTVQIKRVAGGSDLSGVFVSIW